MRVQVLFFGMLRELIGRSSEEIDLPDGTRLETVFDRYASRFPRLREMKSSIVLARNHEFASGDVVLSQGDEIALMPPVSGGSAGEAVPSSDMPSDTEWLASEESLETFYGITRTELDSRWLVSKLQGQWDGAVITFEGVVRDHSIGRETRYLDYDCYVPLAVKKMQDIGNDVLAKHEVRAIGVVHRIGRLEIGEASIVIVVASPHRQAAYDASLEAINRVKKLVPIWKKEYFTDGEIWVEGEWEDNVPRPAEVT